MEKRKEQHCFLTPTACIEYSAAKGTYIETISLNYNCAKEKIGTLLEFVSTLLSFFIEIIKQSLTGVGFGRPCCPTVTTLTAERLLVRLIAGKREGHGPEAEVGPVVTRPLDLYSNASL